MSAGNQKFCRATLIGVTTAGIPCLLFIVSYGGTLSEKRVALGIADTWRLSVDRDVDFIETSEYNRTAE